MRARLTYVPIDVADLFNDFIIASIGCGKS